MENESLNLLVPAPEDKLRAWLYEFYGKPVHLEKRELLRHRDLSYVERLWIEDGFPKTLIYKLVLPPWDVEQHLLERILIPCICNSAQLYLAANFGDITAMFLEDLGTDSLRFCTDPEVASRVGTELAKLHRAYCYRIDELNQLGVLQTLYPIDYEDFALHLSNRLYQWDLISKEQQQILRLLSNVLGPKLAGEPISLVHGDFYAENLICRDNHRLGIIDWSWFTHIGAPLMDVATLTTQHAKNGSFTQYSQEVIDAYCFESGRNIKDVCTALPFAEALSRLFFLHWLVERRSRGIMGTTIGQVDGLIPQIVTELSTRLSNLLLK